MTAKKQNSLRWPKRLGIAIALAAVLCSSTPALAETPMDAEGVYRPLTTLRKYKLATSFFVNPDLPKRARIVEVANLDVLDQYPSREVLEGITKDHFKIAVPVEGESGYAPVDVKSWWAYTSHRQPADFNVENLRSAIKALPDDQRDRIRLFVLNDEYSQPESERYITWDPHEVVSWSGPPIPDPGNI